MHSTSGNKTDMLPSLETAQSSKIWEQLDLSLPSEDSSSLISIGHCTYSMFRPQALGGPEGKAQVFLSSVFLIGNLIQILSHKKEIHPGVGHGLEDS